MKKENIVDYVFNNTDLTKVQAIQAVEKVFESMTEALGNGDSIHLRGFATFKARMRKAKPAQNISKKETIMLPPRRDVKLVLGKEILRRLNG